MWNRGAYATCEQMRDIEQALPFALRMLDFDNGSEFLNAHFISHFKSRDPAVELSRSRPYHKNDNAHIEQKNYTHVRLVLGDDRFEEFALVAPLNAVFRSWSLWNNLASTPKTHETQTLHGVLHREVSNRLLKSPTVSYFNEASRGGVAGCSPTGLHRIASL